MKKQLKNFIKKSPKLLFCVKYVLSKLRQIHSKSKWSALIETSEIKLELGSGPKKGKDGWTTVDIGSSIHTADISWDLRRGIPLSNESVMKIYSSHLLEHIPYEQLLKFLQDCHRVLKAEGVFLVCVPNFRIYIDAYKKGQMFRSRDTWWQPGVINTGSCIDQLNYMAYMKDEHKYMFDEENLINTLLKAGFSSAKLRAFDPHLDLKERDYESIYAVAYK